MKRLKAALQLVLVLLFVGVAALVYAYTRLSASMDERFGMSMPATFTVKRGQTLKPVLHELHKDGVVESPNAVYLYARLHELTQVRAGDYLVGPDDTPRSLLDKLASGRVKTEQLAIIEGHNRWQVRSTLAAAKWMSAAEFDRLCDDAAFLKHNGIPGPTCEGYLFPDTYTFARGLPPETILATLFATYKKVFAEVTKAGNGPLGYDMQRFTTLASIVEKETGLPSDRPHVACVFYNRLTARPIWRLETDPTVIYAATLADPSFDGNIKREHLRELNNPYNTYRVFGLPPGPIANPGRAALEAVRTPLACKDYFFVSMNNGQSVFCPTLECHNKAVSEWQIRYFRNKRGKGARSKG